MIRRVMISCVRVLHDLHRPIRPPCRGARMHFLADAGSSDAVGFWAYLVVFAAAAAGYMGIPLIGTAVIGFAAVLASQGRLNIAAVLAVAAIGCEIGGLGGYKIGGRWGRQLAEHPGPALEWRKKAVG